MNEFLISVIVPVYNAKLQLSRCVESIIQQSWENMEILLVDDGSTDGSGKFCDAFAGADSRIHASHKDHEGVGSARNYGLDQMRGEYVLFMDTEDILHSRCLEVLAGLASQYGADVVWGAGKVVKNDMVDLFEELGTESEGLDGKEAIRRICLGEGSGPDIRAKLFHKKLFKKVRYAGGNSCEDIVMIPRLVLAAEKAAAVPDILHYHCVRAQNLTQPFSRKKYTDLCAALKEAKELIGKSCTGLDDEYNALEISELFASAIDPAMLVKEKKALAQEIRDTFSEELKKGAENPCVDKKRRKSLKLLTSNSGLFCLMYSGSVKHPKE